MSIPDYEPIMLPLLKYSADEREHSIREAIDFLTDKFGLSNEEIKELLPSGKEPRINNRIRWAKEYLKKAGLLEIMRRKIPAIKDPRILFRSRLYCLQNIHLQRLVIEIVD